MEARQQEKIDHLNRLAQEVSEGISTEEWAFKYGSGYETLMAIDTELDRIVMLPLDQITEKDLSLEEWKQ
ncbi:MAG: hypothetical protein HN356_15065 [Calditrichaeota bacterium]|jgi:hypothetical protein|nr:hypothetical protein [Calditrichota bacterium]